MAEQVIRWVTPVDPARPLDPLKHFLARIDADRGWHPDLPLARLPMVHFASLTVFSTERLLVFESNIDGPEKDYVRELVNVGRTGLDFIYQDNPDYRRLGPERFFRKLKEGTHLYHIGHPNRKVQEIKGDLELRRSIAHALDTDPRLQRMLREHSPAEIVRHIRQRTHSPRPWFWQRYRPWNAAWDGPSPNPPTPLEQIEWEPDKWSGWLWLARVFVLFLVAWLIATALVVVLNPLVSPRVLILLETIMVFFLVKAGSGEATMARSAVLALFFGFLVAFPFRFPAVVDLITTGWVWYVAAGILVVPGLMLLSLLHMVWRVLVSDPKAVPSAVKARIPVLLEAEDRYQKNSHYNHVAGLSELKSNFRWLRFVRSRLAMELLNLFYRTEYVKGRLVTIPSIHFAQWSVVNRRYVLFVTNYDGPADSYLDDFFNTLAFGVAFIWQDTKIFPMTIDPRRLKLWVREGQTLASMWYRAPVYEGLTVGAINNNTFIRKRLLRGRTEASARRWLRRFATIPEQPGLVAQLTKWTKELVGVRG